MEDGRSRCWNRSEIGGKGGNANSTESTDLAKQCNVDKEDNPKINTNSGWDGEDGEDCGIVKINDDIKVYAYGGNGGDGMPGISAGAGGRRRLSSSTESVGGGARTEDGADHCNGGGGFTGSGGQSNEQGGHNGNGGGEKIFDNSLLLQNPLITPNFDGYGSGNQRFGSGALGGQGGWPWSGSSHEPFYRTRGGSRWKFWGWWTNLLFKS